MIKDLLTIKIKFSESHLVFPRITLTILIVLGGLIVIQYLSKKYKEGTLGQFNFKFFKEGYDKLKLFGTLAALVGYVLLLEAIGFLIATVIFVFAISLLFMGDLKPKTLIISLINSLATSYAVWFIFGKLINITLP